MDNYLLAVITQPVANASQILCDIFDVFWERAILNAIAIVSPKTGSIILSGYLPYEDDCVSMKRIDFGQWTHRDEVKFDREFREIFPIKANDMKQCPLHVAAFNLPPYVIKDKNGNYGGIEIELLKLLARDLNFSIRFYAGKPNEMVRGAVLSNGTITGIMGLVCQFFTLKLCEYIIQHFC